MGLLNIFSKKQLKDTSVAKENESKLYVETLYSSSLSFIVLFSFSDDYYRDALEFTAACSLLLSSIKVKIYDSEYETEPEDLPDVEPTDNSNVPLANQLPSKLDALRPEKIVHIRHYLVVSIQPERLNFLYSRIDISNAFADVLKDEIYQHISSTHVNKHLNDVFDLNKFKYKKVLPKYPTSLVNLIDGFYSDNIQQIDSVLPAGHTLQDIFDLGRMITDLNSAVGLSAIIEQSSSSDNVLKAIICTWPKLIDFKDYNELRKYLLKPKYLLDDGDALPGNVDDEKLDEIFRKKYDTFNAAEFYNYEELDEEIETKFSDDEVREYIDNKSGDMNDITEHT